MDHAEDVVALADACIPEGLADRKLPPFVIKLWAMVEDPDNTRIIFWTTDGLKICIFDAQKLAYNLVPKYFRHNNISSFIRQLNLYGFRKVLTVQNPAIQNVGTTPMIFQHPSFLRGRPDLLINIKRKEPTPKALTASPEDVKTMISKFQAISNQQNCMSEKLEIVTRGNKTLNNKVDSLHQKSDEQKQSFAQFLDIIMDWVSEGGRLETQIKRALTDASGAPPAKKRRPEAQGAMEDPETEAVPGPSTGCLLQQAVPGPSTGWQTVLPNNMQSGAWDAGVLTLEDKQLILDILCCFGTNLLEIESLLKQKYSSMEDVLNLVFFTEELSENSGQAPAGTVENAAENTDATGMNVQQQAPMNNDGQLMQNDENDIKEEPNAFRARYNNYAPSDASEAGPSSAFVDEAPQYLSPANLSPANLSPANLAVPNLSPANLFQAYPAQANHALANLPPANLAPANLAPANLAPANLAVANLAVPNLAPANLAVPNLAAANLAVPNFAPANLAPANLAPANLAPANLAVPNLAPANLAPANLAPANLAPADLAVPNLAPANLAPANLAVPNLAPADLVVPNLAPANLAPANLAVPNLAPADLGLVNLAPANFPPANFAPANLAPANQDDALPAVILQDPQFFYGGY